MQGFKGITGDLSFNEKSHITITKDQLTLVKFDAKSNAWVAVE